MNKKKIDVERIQNELTGGSVFFQDNPNGLRSQDDSPPLTPATAPELQQQQESATASKRASTLAVKHDDAVIATIRRAVRGPGKEVAYLRLTLDEKRRLGDVLDDLRRQGTKSTENEVGRIALNFILEDNEQNGDKSILAGVLASLRA